MALPDLKWPVTALVGRAGSGKSTLLRAFWSLPRTLWREGANGIGIEITPRQIERWPWMEYQHGDPARWGEAQSRLIHTLTFANRYLNEGSILLTDSVDCHPSDGQRLIMELIELATERGGKVVIVVNCVCQLDQLSQLGHEGAFEGVICLHRRERDQPPVWRRLSDHPGSVERRKYFRPGEFWSCVGEEWVSEATCGDPAAGDGVK